MPRLIPLFFVLFFALSACQPSAPAAVAAPAADAAQSSIPEAESTQQEPTAAPEPTNTPQPSPTIKPTLKIDPTATKASTPTFTPKMLDWMKPGEKGKGYAPLTLHYYSAAETELVDANGQRVLVDIVVPVRLSTEPTAADLLLITHGHPDHLNAAFVNKSFPGQKMVMAAGALALDGIGIRGIPGQHNAGDEITETYASNYLFIIDIGGLRVLHCGDLGQTALLPEQLAAIGQVDVAIMQLSNSYSSMSLKNQKGFNLLDQINPRLIIPTHIDQDTAAYAVEKWKAFFLESTEVQLSPDALPAETTILFMGNNSQSGKNAQALPWEK